MHYLFSEDEIVPEKKLTDEEFDELAGKIYSHPLFN